MHIFRFIQVDKNLFFFYHLFLLNLLILSLVSFYDKKMITKNVLMLVILSAGMLTGLTATMIQAAPVYADTEDCKKNDDNNCNDSHERSIKIEQENNCKIENSDSADGGDSDGDGSSAGNGGDAGDNSNTLACANEVFQPNTGNDAFNGQQVP